MASPCDDLLDVSLALPENGLLLQSELSEFGSESGIPLVVRCAALRSCDLIPSHAHQAAVILAVCNAGLEVSPNMEWLRDAQLFSAQLNVVKF